MAYPLQIPTSYASNRATLLYIIRPSRLHQEGLSIRLSGFCCHRYSDQLECYYCRLDEEFEAGFENIVLQFQEQIKV